MKHILLSVMSLLVACSGDIPSSISVSDDTKPDSDLSPETNDSGAIVDSVTQTETMYTDTSDIDACNKEAMCKGKNCGFVSDKCGNTYPCGPETCTAPNTCGGGGTPNVCGCTAKTKDEACLGLDCNMISNGCNPTPVYNCGTDPASKSFPAVCPLTVSTGTSYAYRFCGYKEANKCYGCTSSSITSCSSKPGYPIALNCPIGYSHGGGGPIPFFAVSTDCALMGDGSISGNKEYCCVAK